MFETYRGKIAFSGVTVLGIGVALLIFTFASAYSFLVGGLQILSTQDLAQTFGDSLAPLIATSIRIMYLGVMGWIGSLVTIRGVTIIANTPKPETAEIQETQEPQQKTQPQQTQQKVKNGKETKPEMKPTQPEMLVIPLEEMEQQQTTAKSKTK
jgi:hypothetical protein